MAIVLTPAERLACEERLSQIALDLAAMKCARAWDLRAEQGLLAEAELLDAQLRAATP